MSAQEPGETPPFDALAGSGWEDATPRVAGPCPVNVTLSVSELVFLRDAHRALMRDADRRHVEGWLSEHEFHDMRATYFNALARNLAPDLLGPPGDRPMRLSP